MSGPVVADAARHPPGAARDMLFKALTVAGLLVGVAGSVAFAIGLVATARQLALHFVL